LNIELRTSNKAKVPLTPALSPSDGERETTAVRLLGNLVVLALVCISAGCVTKSKAKAEAQSAFLAGQQQAMIRMSQPHQPVVTFIGPVRNPTVQWSQDLTLAKAIVAAGYDAKADPRQIMIVRNGQAIPVDPKKLLEGEDIPLVAGDLVQIGQ
jgi:hypothetical protein